jgi:hypothetical protein
VYCRACCLDVDVSKNLVQNLVAHQAHQIDTPETSLSQLRSVYGREYAVWSDVSQHFWEVAVQLRSLCIVERVNVRVYRNIA